MWQVYCPRQKTPNRLRQCSELKSCTSVRPWYSMMICKGVSVCVWSSWLRSCHMETVPAHSTISRVCLLINEWAEVSRQTYLVLVAGVLIIATIRLLFTRLGVHMYSPLWPNMRSVIHGAEISYVNNVVAWLNMAFQWSSALFITRFTPPPLDVLTYLHLHVKDLNLTLALLLGISYFW